MKTISHITAIACGTLLSAVLAPGEAKALTFYKYTFTPATANFGFRIDPSLTAPTPPASPSFPGQDGAGVNGISLEGTLFWDGPGTSALTGSLTIRQFVSQSSVGEAFTFDCAVSGTTCNVVSDQFFQLSVGSDTLVQFKLNDPTLVNTYDQDDDPFDQSSPTNNTVALAGADQTNLSTNVQYFVDANDQIGGVGTITVQALPGPFSPLSLSPLLLGLKSARKRYSNLLR